MNRGTFVAFVGPSGAGKDSIMRGVGAARTDVVAARRVITRPAGPTEDYLGVDRATFDAMKAAGDFALDWEAHGLRYGIPASIDADLAAGRHVLANLSRSAIPRAARRFSPMLTISVTAPTDVLAIRLTTRGREDRANVERRLDRATVGIPRNAPVVEIRNDGALDDAVAAAIAALPQPVSG